jgi:serine/threonine protein kinase
MVLDRGLPLDQWIKSKRSPNAVLAMAAEVLELLSVLHRAGAVHRDIKPSNLLLMLQTQEWRLLDFGIAETVGVLHCHSLLYHTFVAPEVCPSMAMLHP